MPDVVLHHILSFLPTIYAVQTTILSRRWKNLWTSVHSLVFDEDDYHEDFPRYVDNVLFFRDSSDIQKFFLSCGSVEDISRIDGWVPAAIWFNVAELHLSVESDPIFELPKSLFLCKTLKKLTLTSNFIFNTPIAGCFPSLKYFQVIIYRPVNNSVEKLFSSCPVLEYLFISRIHRNDAVLNFNVSAPELKTLKMSWDTYGNHERCSFFIAAPKLENFVLDQNVLTDCFLENARSLAEATIALYNRDANEGHRFTIRATALLARICNVKYLSLSAHYLMGCCLPYFNNLSKLELVLHYCYYRELLTALLKGARNLECLVLQLEDNICKESSEPQWNPPELVPLCLLSHLKTISIRGFNGKLDEMEEAKYLLKKGEVLKKMTTYARDPLRTKEELYKELSTCQRGSETCQVEVI